MIWHDVPPAVRIWKDEDGLWHWRISLPRFTLAGREATWDLAVAAVKRELG